MATEGVSTMYIKLQLATKVCRCRYLYFVVVLYLLCAAAWNVFRLQ